MIPRYSETVKLNGNDPFYLHVRPSQVLADPNPTDNETRITKEKERDQYTSPISIVAFL